MILRGGLTDSLSGIMVRPLPHPIGSIDQQSNSHIHNGVSTYST